MRERGNYFAEIERLAVRRPGRRSATTAGRCPRSTLLAIVSPPRVHGELRRGPAQVGAVGDRPAATGASTSSRRRWACTRRGPSCCRRSGTSCSAMTYRVTSPTSSGSGSRPTTSPRRCWSPSSPPRAFLADAKQARDLSVEDLRDVFSVSYEMAAHRFTNLATHHLGLPCHFVKNDESGVIYKAYENDGAGAARRRVRGDRGPAACAAGGRAARSSPRADRFSPDYQYTRHAVGHLLVRRLRRTLGASAASPSPSASRTSTPAGSAAATRPSRVVSRCPDGDCCQRPPDRAGRALGGHGLAVGPGPLAHPVRAADRELPGVDDDRRVRVPRLPRPRVKDWQNGFRAYPAGNRLAPAGWTKIMASPLPPSRDRVSRPGGLSTFSAGLRPGRTPVTASPAGMGRGAS